jgi:transcription elongation factor Elf1
MRCPKCGKEHLVETRLDTSTKKVVCKDCGFSETRDDRNLPLLIEVPSAPGSGLLG